MSVIKKKSAKKLLKEIGILNIKGIHVKEPELPKYNIYLLQLQEMEVIDKKTLDRFLSINKQFLKAYQYNSKNESTQESVIFLEYWYKLAFEHCFNHLVSIKVEALNDTKISIYLIDNENKIIHSYNELLTLINNHYPPIEKLSFNPSFTNKDLS